MSLNDFAINTLGKIISAGGEIIKDQEYERRAEICRQCPYFGEVKPLPLISAQGCTICGCPLRTKARTKTHFSVKEQKIIKTICPHPDGDKWALN